MGEVLSDKTKQKIDIDFFRNEDAPGIARLFREVYGEGYPIRTYYEAEQIIAENASGHIISCVARTSAGEVVGHDALVLLDSDNHLYENAGGAVLPSFHGQGIFPRLFKHTIVNTVERFDVKEIIGEPVCNHTHLQKMCLQLDYRESGLEADLMPAAAYGITEPGTSGRVSVLLGFFMHTPRMQAVQIPPVYHDELEYLYSGLNLDRTFASPDNDLPSGEDTRGGMKVFTLAQVARIKVDNIGRDFEPFISRLESEACKENVVIIQVWLPLTSLFTSAATNILRERGFFLGGVLPCFLNNGDGMLMQKVNYKPDWEGIKLFSERAKIIKEMIKRDWESVNSRK